jgi:hypothetical protein
MRLFVLARLRSFAQDRVRRAALTGHRLVVSRSEQIETGVTRPETPKTSSEVCLHFR